MNDIMGWWVLPDKMSSSTTKDKDSKKQKACNSPERVQLSEEEKAVLVECRRNSLARGIPLGVAAVLTLRWFVHQGRVPAHVKRWTGLYYTGVFMGSFYMGVASYKKQCMDKIMALDNSFIKDQIQNVQAKIHSCVEEETAKANHQLQRETGRAYAPPSHYQPPPSKTGPNTPPPDVYVNPAAKRSYEKEKALMDTSEHELEQPDAFSGQSVPPVDEPSVGQQVYRDPQPFKARGRTYDDVRELAHRRSQREGDIPQYRGNKGQAEEDYRQPRGQPQQQGRRKVRTNQYGDEVEN